MTSEQKNILLGAIIGFTLSVISQLITSITKYFYKKHKVCTFRKLIFNTYIKNIKDGLMLPGDGNIAELKKSVSNSITKLDYLLKNELTYLNADWQFEAIRICEFAKAKLKQVTDQLENYSFKNNEMIMNGQGIKLNKKNSLIIITDYEKRVVSYHKLKTEKTVL